MTVHNHCKFCDSFGTFLQAYQHLPSTRKVVIGGSAGDVSAELAGLQLLQKHPLLLQHLAAIQMLQVAGHPHNLFPAGNAQCYSSGPSSGQLVIFSPT